MLTLLPPLWLYQCFSMIVSHSYYTTLCCPRSWKLIIGTDMHGTWIVILSPYEKDCIAILNEDLFQIVLENIN